MRMFVQSRQRCRGRRVRHVTGGPPGGQTRTGATGTCASRAACVILARHPPATLAGSAHGHEKDRPQECLVCPVRRRFGRHQRSEEHTSELQSPCNLVCRLLLEKKKKFPE